MSQKKTAWAAIFARGGSKGVVGKNLKQINGISLVERAVKKALLCPSIERVFLSTDDTEIRAAGIKAGAEAPFLRPSELASDEAAEILSWQHMVTYWQDNFSILPDLFVSVPTVCPLGTPDDIENTISTLRAGSADMALTVTEDISRSAYLTGQLDGKNEFSFLIEKTAQRRQDFPTIYKIIALCYVTTPAYILSTTDLMTGIVQGVPIPESRALDIDTEFEFKLAEMLLAVSANEYIK